VSSTPPPIRTSPNWTSPPSNASWSSLRRGRRLHPWDGKEDLTFEEGCATCIHEFQVTENAAREREALARILSPATLAAARARAQALFTAIRSAGLVDVHLHLSNGTGAQVVGPAQTYNVSILLVGGSLSVSDGIWSLQVGIS
jgi:hypothetical protein